MSDTHALGFHKLSDRMEVAATCDIVRERAEKAAELYGAPVAVEDYRDLTDLVDAVLVVLPHDLHFEAGMYFLRAGKHVLMEKPMCNTEMECLMLIQTAEETGKVLMTAYPVRFW